jgi:hypothetical protein
MSSPTENEFNVLQEYSDSFDKLCQERHLAGQKEYGALTFIGNDVVRMMAEELADTANYCRYQFIKLMMLQEALEAQLSGTEEALDQFKVVKDTLTDSFKGTSQTGWKKND